MDSNQPASSTPPPFTPAPPPPPPQNYGPVAASPGMFGTKIPSAVAFAVVILVFLLPFSEIRCSGQSLMNNTGIGFALGKEWKIAGGMGQDMTKDMTTKTGGKQSGHSQLFIIAALGLGVLGLILALADKKPGYQLGLVFGILGAGVLIAFMLDLKKWFNDGLAKQAAEKASEGTDSLGMGKLGDMNLTLGFTPWYFVAVIGFLVAAFFCYKRMTTFKP